MAWDRDAWIAEHSHAAKWEAEQPTPEKEAAVLEHLREHGEVTSSDCVMGKVRVEGQRFAHAEWLAEFMAAQPNVKPAYVSRRNGQVYGWALDAEYEGYEPRD